jgi:murein DD-endopeptidase MepM/ murein hydrolase activator NlpD
VPRAGPFLALIVSACAAGGGAPISYGGAGTPAPRSQPSEQRGAPQSEAPPAPDWADGEGTPLSVYALQPRHGFDPANPPRAHTVAADETLYDIATRYQIPIRALIDQNRLEPPYALPPGRVIALPPPRFHVVARGESLEDVARRYDIDARSLALLNRMQPPYEVRRGDRLVLPAIARQYEEAAPNTPRPSAAAPNPSGRFAWPLRGEIVARYGAQPGGVRVDGIEIAGREGATVSAAADGDVVYAGADIEGLGHLVLIRHADNYVTAYAYNRRALVREGQRVRAGEAVAELGARPNGQARLLFQVRRGSEALDPAPLLTTRDP